MPKITPFPWFDGNAEALNFYTAIFKNAKVAEVIRVRETDSGESGPVVCATFELEGQAFIGFNGGSAFSFTPAISLFVRCETQEELVESREKLLDGGKPRQCGWLTDRFGISWQIVPTILQKLLRDKDAERSGRVVRAMLNAVKPDIGLSGEA